MIYDRASQDPRVSRLGHPAYAVWVVALTTCSSLGRETLAFDELSERLEVLGRSAVAGEPPLSDMVAELVAAELLERLPHGHVRLLARLDLWAFEDEAEAW